MQTTETFTMDCPLGIEVEIEAVLGLPHEGWPVLLEVLRLEPSEGCPKEAEGSCTGGLSCIYSSSKEDIIDSFESEEAFKKAVVDAYIEACADRADAGKD